MKVIGLTGTIGAGKEIVKEFLIRRYNSYYVTLSDIIRAEMEKKKNKLNRTTLQDMGNELRKKYGTHILAMLAVEYLQRNKELIIINGIRNPGEADYLKKKFGNGFKLIAIDAPAEVRFERILKRGQHNDPQTWEEFVVADERDQGKNEPEYGQQVRQCVDKADFIIINDGSIEEFEKRIEETVAKIM